MLRVAHVISTPSGIGGAEKMLGSLVAAGLERGHEQIVLNPFAVDPSAFADVVSGVPVVPIPCRSLVTVPAMRRVLKKEIMAFHPQVVHAHLFHAQVAVASLRLNAATIATHHHGELFSALGNTWRLLLDRVSSRQFTTVVAVSESVRHHLLASNRLSKERVVTIRNGWQGSPLTPAPQKGLILSVANFRTEKDHDTLLRAFAKVVANGADARLRLFGSGPLEASVRNLAEQLSISELVEFRGSVTDIWTELRKAHIFALASRVEPLGIAALEAMGAGVPVVATNVGGLPEIIKSGESGYLVPSGDTDAFADALGKLLIDPPLASKMGSQAARNAARFRMEETIARYFELYDLLAA